MKRLSDPYLGEGGGALCQGAIAQTLPSGSVQVQWGGECENTWKVEEGAVWWWGGAQCLVGRMLPHGLWGVSTVPGLSETQGWPLA